ncbi:MAG TPA: T9SS type A sorting domain-containing protein [Candidatus Eisenbacteria bacterium]|nr:T9SS type A sorting domain-containing protein [Candidatus Eisenbacteria bacterium]
MPSTSNPRRYAIASTLLGALLLVALAVPRTAGAADVVLHWTAPGDDGNSGTASMYMIRYSLQPLAGSQPADSADWWTNLSTPVGGSIPTPRVAGTREMFTMTDLDSGTVYYYMIRTCDEIPNCSGYSNLAPKVAGVNPVPVESADMIGYPNPATDHVTFRFQAGTKTGSPGPARLTIYDLNGRRVVELLNEVLPAGEQTVLWACQSDAGNHVAPGLYNAILEAPTGREIRQIVVLPE